jgi:hypothetical protein
MLRGTLRNVNDLTGCSKRFRFKAREDRAAERTLDVREQRESKRNAADHGAL